MVGIYSDSRLLNSLSVAMRWARSEIARSLVKTGGEKIGWWRQRSDLSNSPPAENRFRRSLGGNLNSSGRNEARSLCQEFALSAGETGRCAYFSIACARLRTM